MINEKKTRIPTQKRALEKIDKITDAAFKLFNEKGYYNTTTADIAKEAGVATGSVYAYFEDKKDIYILVLKNIYDKFMGPTDQFWANNSLSNFENSEAIKEMFGSFVKLMLRYHDFTKTFHDEMNALALIHDEIGELLTRLEEARNEKVQQIIEHLGITFKSEEDSKILQHYSILLIDDVCHRICYDPSVTNIQLYIDRCSDMLYTLFQGTTNY